MEKREIKMFDGSTQLVIAIPNTTRSHWIHFNHIYGKVDGGFELVYDGGEVLTERQQAECLEMTHDILGTFDPATKEVDFEVQAKWGGGAWNEHHRDWRTESYVKLLTDFIEENKLQGDKYLILINP